MSDIRRRDLIGYLGVAVGSSIASGSLHAAEALPGHPEPPAAGGRTAWVYATIEPALAGKRVYEIFGQGGCMYAAFGGIFGCQRAEAGNSLPEFPLHMMRYGAGGVSGWGTLCGALNGAAAIIGLFVADKQGRDRLINDLFSWYERTKLPRYHPGAADGPAEIMASTSRSVLCHVSVGTWCRETGAKTDSKETTERCRRLTVDVAMKTVELLNAYHLGGQAEPQSGAVPPAGPEPKAATIPGEAIGKMRCDSCHQPGESHVNVGSLSGKQAQ